MYPKRRFIRKRVLDDLDNYREATLRMKVENGVLNPADAGFIQGHNKASIYSEEERKEKG